MKCIITEDQMKKIMEFIDSEKVICNECGWSWRLSEGGNDPYVCHNCGLNNEE